MLSRGFKICFGVGIVLVLFALGLHAVYPFYNAPAGGAEYDLLNLFAATFASTNTSLSASGLRSSTIRS